MKQLGNLKLDIQHHFDKEQRRITIAQIFDLEGKLISRGRSICSNKDQFNKKKGNKVAISKALTGSTVSKSERKLFWEGYRTLTKVPRWNINS